jgi:hypothetical protein
MGDHFRTAPEHFIRFEGHKLLRRATVAIRSTMKMTTPITIYAASVLQIAAITIDQEHFAWVV